MRAGLLPVILAMKFSHREDKRGDRLFDVLTDEENGLRLIVSRLGAELISVARRDAGGKWIGFLNRDNEIGPPEKGWANHATVMGYYLHRIKNERTLYRETRKSAAERTFSARQGVASGEVGSRRRTDLPHHSGRFFANRNIRFECCSI